MYYIRLDDASDKRDVLKWDRIESLLDEYNILPLVGVIPENMDETMKHYPKDEDFWGRVKHWEEKGWTIAAHGYNHVFATNEGGINPVNYRSEFAGLSLEEQIDKISKGLQIFKKHSVKPTVFFAPAHTFDLNTLSALEQTSDIRVISDTISNKPYSKYGFTFIPQQSGRVRLLPFKTVTFCYHPNIMTERDFEELESFIIKHRKHIKNYEAVITNRKESFLDKILKKVYFARRRK